jgi:hypothetical protein
MATPQKFAQFAKDIVDGKHAFNTHAFKVMLTNVAPPLTTAAVKADLTEIAAGNGYTAGGNTVTVTTSTSAGVAKVTVADTTFAASGGAMATWRYAILYNDTTSGKPLIASIDYGASITLAAGQSSTVDFDGTSGLMQVY